MDEDGRGWTRMDEASGCSVRLAGKGSGVAVPYADGRAVPPGWVGIALRHIVRFAGTWALAWGDGGARGVTKRFAGETPALPACACGALGHIVRFAKMEVFPVTAWQGHIVRLAGNQRPSFLPPLFTAIPQEQAQMDSMDGMDLWIRGA